VKSLLEILDFGRFATLEAIFDGDFGREATLEADFVSYFIKWSKYL
jgi:hypothetical protein